MNTTNQQIILKDNRKLGFAEYGDPNGYAIIYCHGSQSSRLEMHYDMSFATRNNLRIVTVDRPGHGISNLNPSGTILDFANDVGQLTEHLKIDRFSVAGMSAGSPFALGIAYTFPERVDKTAIISGFAPYTNESRAFLGREVKAMLKLAKTTPFLVRLLLRVQAKQLAKKPEKALAGFLKIMSEPDQEVLKNESVMKVIETMFKEAFRNGSKGVAHEISKILVRDWNFELGDIKVPVRFWQGEADNNVPRAWAEMMQRQIPGSELTLFANEGHLIIFGHAEQIFTDLK